MAKCYKVHVNGLGELDDYTMLFRVNQSYGGRIATTTLRVPDETECIREKIAAKLQRDREEAAATAALREASLQHRDGPRRRLINEENTTSEKHVPVPFCEEIAGYCFVMNGPGLHGYETYSHDACGDFQSFMNNIPEEDGSPVLVLVLVESNCSTSDIAEELGLPGYDSIPWRLQLMSRRTYDSQYLHEWLKENERSWASKFAQDLGRNEGFEWLLTRRCGGPLHAPAAAFPLAHRLILRDVVEKEWEPSKMVLPADVLDQIVAFAAPRQPPTTPTGWSTQKRLAISNVVDLCRMSVSRNPARIMQLILPDHDILTPGDKRKLKRLQEPLVFCFFVVAIPILLLRAYPANPYSLN